ncbi:MULTISPECIES: bifunctional RNase H/acid phosphatase [unclassified Streptomyces]|uniref:bifunctional RNase H/acid phosphatase n=1 Tax=unclassified Streptomyces TaxID=2593676 RepID=UPI00202583EB|nr:MULTISPECIES: bifunctional RNase H/acid phosphatase [unclassified Streptomyces]MCX4551430.1 bifunctional RNase H/acid phosphatase [Streptomyces sp. NBC_01500]WSV58752.1 bifunctional RNase H/acid phosphatase [Streptomyces sp. NBC_01014]
MREFVVEADGGSRGNPGPAGYGAVVLDPATGETLTEAAEFIGFATNNVAEYRGLIAGLRAAAALDPAARVRVRMDSKLVVEQMSGRWQIKHPDMKPLAAEAATVLPRSQVTYEWIPRERNKHADRLANEAMDAGRDGRQWEPSDSTADLGAPSAPEATGAPAAPPVGWSAPADLGAPATFVLLRHGETALTPEKRFSGSGGTDPELSATGREQAERAAAAFAARGTIQAVVSSPLRRCRETAQTVADRLGLPVRIEEGLRETDFGAWEGLTFGEARERYRADLDAWLASPKAAPTGGGESFATVARRVASARDRLIAGHRGTTALLVTHVTPIKTLVRLALGAPPESLFRMELSAASVSAVAYYADGNASVRLLNDTSHLR